MCQQLIEVLRGRDELLELTSGLLGGPPPQDGLIDNPAQTTCGEDHGERKARVG